MGQPVGDDGHSGAGDEVSSCLVNLHDDSFDDALLPPGPPIEDAPPEKYSFSQSSGSGSSSSGSGARDWERDRGRGAHASTVVDVTFRRTPPHNIEAEQSVLGAMLLNSEVIADVYEQLTPENLYRPARRTIYSTILHLYGESSEIDPILLAGRLDRAGDLERIGGPLYLHTLASLVLTAANAQFYARIAAEKTTIRRLVETGTKIVQIGYAGVEDMGPEQLVSEAQQLILSVGRENTESGYVPIAGVLNDTLEKLDLITQNGGLAQGVPTGVTNLGKLTSSLHPGQMVIVAARPGVGKSTLAMDFVHSASIRSGMTSAIFSLEMSRNEVIMRIMSAETKINTASLRFGGLDERGWTKLVEVSNGIRDAPLFIGDSPNLTMAEIHTKAHQLKQKRDLKMIVVDYLQLMSSGKEVESKQQEVSEFSRQLKLLTKELEVPLIAISQLNHGPEARTDKKSQVSDLHESGLLEQDADVVVLIYRSDSQEADHERAGEADIIVAEYRSGPTGSIAVAHRLYYSRFANLAEEPGGSF